LAIDHKRRNNEANTHQLRCVVSFENRRCVGVFGNERVLLCTERVESLQHSILFNKRNIDSDMN
jgi:hypothetical protein